jgi:hypothetical protein
MSRRAGGATRPWWLAVVLGSVACDTVARGDVFEEQIEAAEKAKGNTVEVRCPDKIPLGRIEDNHFECDVDIGMSTVVVTVKLDEKGNLAWKQNEAKFRFQPRAFEVEIRDGIKQQTKIDVTVDCGSERPADPDGSWTCHATAPVDGSRAKVRVTADGSWKVSED